MRTLRAVPLSCKIGGLVILRHNKTRDVAVEVMNEIAKTYKKNLVFCDCQVKESIREPMYQAKYGWISGLETLAFHTKKHFSILGFLTHTLRGIELRTSLKCCRQTKKIRKHMQRTRVTNRAWVVFTNVVCSK